MATIRKRKNHIWKIVNEHGILFKDQNVIMQVSTKEFSKRFINDPEIASHNILRLRNEWLSRDATDEEIQRAVTK